MRSVYAHRTSITGDSGNLGDMMGFHIADAIIGADSYARKGMRHREALDSETVALVGSVIAALVDSPVRVVGGGLINGSTRTYGPDLRVEAVRGFLTQTIIERDAKQIPDVIGDPGLLLPWLSPLPESEKRPGIGYVIHDVDREEFARLYPTETDRIIDNYAARDEFVRQLSQYDAVASTSLHGCIFAHAYGIPVAPFVLTDKVFGGDFKFRDHYSVFGIDARRLPLSGSPEQILSAVRAYPQPVLAQVEDIAARQREVITAALHDR